MKTTKILGVLAVAAGLGYVLYKKYKKEMSKLEYEEKVEEKKLNDLGVSKKKVEKEMVPGDNNLTKAIYAGIITNTKWDLDLIDIDGCLNHENVIHVIENDSQLSFLIEIPSFKDWSHKTPSIGDYITCFSKAADHMWYDITKISKRGERFRPITRLEGYFVVSYVNDEEEEEYKYIKIPEELYKQYSRGKHDGLVEYISAVRDGKETNALEIDDSIEGKAIDVQLFFRISYPIQRPMSNSVGLTLDTGLECLKYLVDELEIGKNSTVTYDHIMFHVPVKAGEDINLFKYYTIDENNTIIIDEYTY